MGVTRQQTDIQAHTRSDTAATIAGLFMANAATEASISALLLPLLPTQFILSAPEQAARVARAAAALILANPPTFSPNAGEFERRASLENILKRGFYAIAAVNRLMESVYGPLGARLGAFGGPTPERPEEALRTEQNYLTAHQNAATQNLEGARRTDRARELHGDVVSWNHGVHGHPVEPRPNHVAADGRTWDLRRGVPVSTGALPRTLPGCTCDWGPAKVGAEVLR